MLQGACDDLLSPRTLGPLRDAARTRAARWPPRSPTATGTPCWPPSSAELGGSRPTVLVLEDVHWADDATLDVLRYVGRRVDELAAVIVVTFRDGEVGRSLQRVLGGLGGPSVRRLALARLSRPAVARLAGGTAATSAPLFALTAGNPFFVSEVLADGRGRRPRDGGRRGARPGAPPRPRRPATRWSSSRWCRRR